MTWRDRTTRHNLSIIVYIFSVSVAAALVLAGLAGVIWGTVEMFRHVTKWVL